MLRAARQGGERWSGGRARGPDPGKQRCWAAGGDGPRGGRRCRPHRPQGDRRPIQLRELAAALAALL
eukprot:3357444-Lingulodinium_polyedra.AAC.1